MGPFRGENKKKGMCRLLRQKLVTEGMYADEKTGHPPQGNDVWRISPEPFWITEEESDFFARLGSHLLAFYKALNALYFASLSGQQPRWVSSYLDQGKPETVVAYGRMKRFKGHLPGVIRPDCVPTDSGMIVTELDSVPGGMGITGCLSREYEALGYQVVGGASGMAEGFSRMVRSAAGRSELGMAVVVSEESNAYLPEMKWLGGAAAGRGLGAFVVEPREVIFTEGGLLVETAQGAIPIHLLYRFFELFDLNNVPKAELILYSAKKEKVVLTPPLKAFLEEKMAFAFLHHPQLAPFWSEEVGEDAFSFLRTLFPMTWLVDPREVPPHAAIPGLLIGGVPVRDFRELARCTQKERQYVLKPSGFSELAWGSRGVAVGHDLPEKEWGEEIERALESFPRVPYILQKFHKGKKFSVAYYDADTDALKEMQGRARLSPYYFVIDGEAHLSGILATVCPLDKKLLHGMPQAVMAPCGVMEGATYG